MKIVSAWRFFRLFSLFILGAVVLAACGGSPTATPQPTAAPQATATPQTGATPVPTAARPQATPTPQKAAWEAEWDTLVAAAEQEGTVVITTFNQPDRAGVEAFGKAFPKIQVEAQVLPGREFSARVPEEQKAGVYSFDIYMSGSTTGSTLLGPQGILADTRAVMFRPDVVNDSNWIGGDFNDWWADDTTKKIQFTHVANFSGSTFRVNRQVAPDVQTLEDWLKPAYKGKVCLEDPRTIGGGDTLWTNVMIFEGADLHRRLLTETEPKISRDLRQLAADTVRGDCAITVGGTFTEFERQGVVGHIDQVNLRFGEVPAEFRDKVKITCCGTGKSKTSIDGQLSSAVGGPALVTKAPHPNAAKLFLNWFAARDGQMAWAEANNFNNCSARVDMQDKCEEADRLPDPNGAYLSFNYGSNDALRRQGREVATQLLGR